MQAQESLPGPAIDCVGAVVFDSQGRLLVVQRANPPAQGTWSIPGGRIEQGEDALSAVRREVREETNLEVEVVREVGTVLRAAPSGGHYVIRDFLAVAADTGLLEAGDDAADARFVPAEELAELPVTSGLIEALHEWGLL
jgi:8-oxo-dGTP diphosphatase